MRRLLIAAALLLIPLAPAHADWAPTKWGMSVSDVVAASPGAKARKYHEANNFGDYHMLAVGRARSGDFDFDVEFFFQPESERLAMVRLKLRNSSRCLAFIASMFPADRGRVAPMRMGPLMLGNFFWSDPAQGDSYFLSTMSTGTKPRDFTLCWLQIDKLA